MTNQTFNLDLIAKGVAPVIHVSQYDKGQTWTVYLYADGVPFSIPAGVAVMILGTKPDGYGFEYTCTYSGSTVTVTLDQQMTAVAGDVVCEIRIHDDDTNSIIGTVNFTLQVEKAALADDTIVSDSDISAIEEAVELVQIVPELLAEVEDDLTTLHGYAQTSEKYATGEIEGTPVPASDPAYENNAKYYAENAKDSADNAKDSEDNAKDSEENAKDSEDNAAISESNAEAWAIGERGGVPVTSGDDTYENNAKYYAENAKDSADNAKDSEDNAEAWADGEKNGTPVTSGAPQYENNAKYWSDLAAQYAQSFSGLVFKGSIAFSSIPTTGMTNGDMYDINEAFTTDNRFEEGSGIDCQAGTDIVWVETDNKWNILTPAGVFSFNGRLGAVSPANGDYNAAQITFNGNSDVNTELNKKLPSYAGDATAWDTTPTNASTKPVTSGGIYTAVNSKANKPTVLTQTLTAGSTIITFTNAAITATATIDVETDNGANYTAISSGTNTVTLTYEAQGANMSVRLIIWEF